MKCQDVLLTSHMCTVMVFICNSVTEAHGWIMNKTKDIKNPHTPIGCLEAGTE